MHASNCHAQRPLDEDESVWEEDDGKERGQREIT